MSLIERTLDVNFHDDYSFFDNLFAGMQHEMSDMEQDRARMRERMFQLVPWNDKDVASMQMEVERPVIEERGQSKLHLKFDVNQFKPDEVEVKMIGGHMLQVHAEHHEKVGGGETQRMFCRQYSLPTGISADTVTAEVTKDGVLTIEGPAPPLSPKEKLIPITYKK